jgi:hypothetical protein
MRQGPHYRYVATGDDMTNALIPAVELAAQIDQLTALIKMQSFTDINQMLKKLDVKMEPTELVVGILRTTYRSRDRLCEWKILLSRAYAEMDSRGLNPNLQLIGLQY